MWKTDRENNNNSKKKTRKETRKRKYSRKWRGGRPRKKKKKKLNEKKKNLKNWEQGQNHRRTDPRPCWGSRTHIRSNNKAGFSVVATVGPMPAQGKITTLPPSIYNTKADRAQFFVTCLKSKHVHLRPCTAKG